MTRKQALALAIEALSSINGSEEARKILHTLSQELPFTQWTKEAIRDAVEQFILEQGRVPTVTDFKRSTLPPHPMIKKRFGLTAKEWLDLHYPNRQPTEEEQREQINAAFIREYCRIRPGTARAFNEARREDCPSWYRVAVRNGLHRWGELLQQLSLPVYKQKPPQRVPPRLFVNMIPDTDFLEFHSENRENRPLEGDLP